MTNRLVLASLSGAMDGGLTAIAEIAEILANAELPGTGGSAASTRLALQRSIC